jgi:probable HAF family extracellular repeat protein
MLKLVGQCFGIQKRSNVTPICRCGAATTNWLSNIPFVAKGGSMIPTPRLHPRPRLVRYLCLLFTTFVIAEAAAAPHAPPAATSSVYLPLVAFRTCRAPTQGWYCLIDLGMVGQNSQAISLNQRSVVVGRIFVPAPTGHDLVMPHAARATSGTLTDLLVSDQYTASSVQSINDTGLVVGDSGNHAFSWSPSTGLLFLEAPSDPQSFALSVNNAGTIVGNAWPQALAWEQNKMVVLPGLPGATESVAYDINNLGQIVGTSTAAATHPNGVKVTRALQWQNHIPQPLDAPSGYLGSRASAINDAAQIVGSLYVNQTDRLGYYRSHAAIWQQNGWQDLGTIAAETSSWANDINNQGQIVGSSELPASQTAEPRAHAVLWQNDSLIDLNTRIVAGGEWEITSAAAINNDGVIVGQAQRGEDQHAILLIPAQ